MSTSSPVSTISWQTPLETTFGRESAIDFSFFRPWTFSRRPCGGCISSTSASFSATASRLGAPNAMAMRRSVPNWLISSGCSEPFGFSNSSAGPPPDFTRRSTISVISRYGSTSAVIRCSSPSRSSSAIHSRRSLSGATPGSVYGGERVARPLRRATSPSRGERVVVARSRPDRSTTHRHARHSRSFGRRCATQPPSRSESAAPRSRPLGRFVSAGNRSDARAALSSERPSALAEPRQCQSFPERASSASS